MGRVMRRVELSLGGNPNAKASGDVDGYEYQSVREEVPLEQRHRKVRLSERLE